MECWIQIKWWEFSSCIGHWSDYYRIFCCHDLFPLQIILPILKAQKCGCGIFIKDTVKIEEPQPPNTLSLSGYADVMSYWFQQINSGGKWTNVSILTSTFPIQKQKWIFPFLTLTVSFRLPDRCQYLYKMSSWNAEKYFLHCHWIDFRYESFHWNDNEVISHH